MQDESDKAFNKAIADGILSDDARAVNFAGHYMFMGYSVSGTRLAFKNIDTRQYIYTERK